MARRLFEFLCEEEHLQERLVSDEVTKLPCEVCGKESLRIISAPRINLEPYSGTFIGATAKWERNRAEKMKQERKRNEGKDNS
jgi:hypothetical protein